MRKRAALVIPILPIFCLFLLQHGVSCLFFVSGSLCWLTRVKAGIVKQTYLNMREWRAELARKIAHLVGDRDGLFSPLPGLLLAKHSSRTAPCSVTHEPSLIIVPQGRKQVDLGR